MYRGGEVGLEEYSEQGKGRGHGIGLLRAACKTSWCCHYVPGNPSGYVIVYVHLLVRCCGSLRCFGGLGGVYPRRGSVSRYIGNLEALSLERQPRQVSLTLHLDLTSVL